MNRREQIAGALSALMFNAGLFGLSGAGIAAWRAYEASEIYTYAATPAASATTRDALDRLGETLLPAGQNRTDAWRELVAREIEENDARAAHGALLVAPGAMAPADANRMMNQLPAEANDDQIAAAALDLLPDDVRDAYRAPNASGRDVELLGDLDNLADASAAWIAGGQADPLMLTLTGIVLAWPDADDPVAAARARSGASVLRIARKTGRLSGAFNAYLTRRVAAAAPEAEVRAALSDAQPLNADAVTRAFQRAVRPEARDALARDLGAIQSIARATDAATAAQLLEHVDNGQELARLRLAAEAGRDRTTFIAKRASRDAVLSAAHGTFSVAPGALTAVVAVVLCMLGIFAGLGIAMFQQAARRRVGDRAVEARQRLAHLQRRQPRAFRIQIARHVRAAKRRKEAGVRAQALRRAGKPAERRVEPRQAGVRIARDSGGIRQISAGRELEHVFRTGLALQAQVIALHAQCRAVRIERDRQALTRQQPRAAINGAIHDRAVAPKQRLEIRALIRAAGRGTGRIAQLGEQPRRLASGGERQVQPRRRIVERDLRTGGVAAIRRIDTIGLSLRRATRGGVVHDCPVGIGRRRRRHERDRLNARDHAVLLRIEATVSAVCCAPYATLGIG
jgi:hypothetical protein